METLFLTSDNGLVSEVRRLGPVIVFDRDFHVESISLRSLVQAVIHENKRFFIHHRVYPQLRVDERVSVESDGKWLSFVVNQLVVNGVKYSADTGKAITFTSYHRGQNIVLEIRDRGGAFPNKISSGCLIRTIPVKTADNSVNRQEWASIW